MHDLSGFTLKSGHVDGAVAVVVGAEVNVR